MKKSLLTVVSGIAMTFSISAQNVTIPDANFKAYLVGNSAINTNADSEIQVSEATAFTSDIYCPYLSITDLTGIEAFINATGLYCNSNQLTSLDISANTALVMLYVQNNQLGAVDLSNNTALVELMCSDNQLTTLNLANNTALEYLDCSINQLTALDVSQNSLLEQILCYNNSIASLDVSANPALHHIQTINNELTSLNLANGNNSNFNIIWAENNPNLTCVQVDDVSYSTANWIPNNFKFDAQQEFNEDCGSLGLKENKTIASVYPNPVNEQLFVESDSNDEIRIINTLGETIHSQSIHSGLNAIDANSFSPGIYFLCSQRSTIKFVKE